MSTTPPDPTHITDHEAEQVKRANASDRTPVAFVHGLWLLPSSWDRWVTFFEEAGFTALTPGWPDDPDTVEEAREHPETFAHKSIGDIADYVEQILKSLDRKPVVIGHSAVPGSGVPLFQAAAANLNPWTEAKVDTDNPQRGPLLIINGEKDHTVPWSIANAAYKQQKDNPSDTEIVEMPDRGHALVIDHGWQEVAQTALDFVRRFS